MPAAKAQAHLAALTPPVLEDEDVPGPTHVRDWNETRGEYDWFAPVEGREDLLDAFQQGPDYEFADNHHVARKTHPAGEPESPEEAAQAEGMRMVDQDPEVRKFQDRGPSHHLSSHVRNLMLLAYQRDGRIPPLTEVLRKVADGSNRVLLSGPD